MRMPYTPTISTGRSGLSVAQIEEMQHKINARYKGVDCEVVTESKGHILKVYVDGIEVAGGLQGLPDAMKNRLST